TLEARVTGSDVEVAFNDWPKNIRENLLPVDKSFILPQVIEDKSPILLTRPCCSGKTMFLSMSNDFFEVPRGETLEDKQVRYRDTMVGAIPGFIDKYCGRYPVIRLDLKESDALPSWHIAHFLEIQGEIDASEERLSALKRELCEKRKLIDTDITSCTGILKSLVQFLNAYHGRECILLIDKLNAPILAASKDNRDAIKNHIRDMLAPVVKNTEVLLSKCIMVGVNPVNPTELGFDVNNFTALPLHYALRKSYTDDFLKCGDMLYLVVFGFTEDEVRKLIVTRVFPGPGKEEMVDIALNVARTWYDGYYVFKNFCIYNPRSVMNFIKALTEGGACSNEAEVFAKAQPYWIDTGSTELLTQMYNELKKINPSISRVLLWMGLDYLSLKNSIEPSASPRTSIQVELSESFGENTIQKTTPYFDERTKEVTVRIAALEDQDSLTDNPTLDKFMTMAYCYGYLTMIREEFLVIPNREVLGFWTQLIINKTGSPDEPSLLRDSRSLTESLVSWNLSEFCDGLEQDFLDYLAKVDPGTSEYSYHESLLLQICLGVDPSQYDCRSEFSVDSGRTGIYLIPKAKGGTGILIESKSTNKDEITDDDCSSSSADADPELLTDASAAAAATTSTTVRSSQDVQGSPQGGDRADRGK
ncbi:hypothetical protein EV182_001073, partial [Spiromyces aspiralis]